MNDLARSPDSPEERKMRLRSEFRELFLDHKGAFGVLLAAGLVQALSSGIAQPILILKITDEGIIQKDLQALAYYSLAALAALAVQAGTFYFINIRRTLLENRMVKEVSLRMLSDFYRIPYREVLRNDRGYFISRIYDETPRAVNPYIGLLTDVAIIAFSSLASMAVLFYLSWRITLLVLLGLAGFYLFSGRLMGKIRDSSRQSSEEGAVSKGVLERLIGVHRIVNLFDLQSVARQRYGQSLTRYFGILFSNARYSIIFRSMGTVVAFGSVLAVLMACGYEVIADRLTLGGLIAISNIYGRLIGYVQALVGALPNLHNARATLDRLFEFRSLAVEPVRHPAPLPSIRLKGMGFAYDGQEICTGVDLTIRPGERVLVMGRNGSGKTTLAHVLAGFLQPTSGEARVPGVPSVSAAFFPPSFLPGSIRRNVAFDRLSSKKKDLLNEIARLLDIQGQLDEDPQELSAGQRQKTSVLRALLKDAELYIFDEPFSNVDSHTKDQLFEVILRVTQGKSLVLIMHCEEQFHAAFDRVVDLDQSGSHLSLPSEARAEG